jgi:hypothetical protein
MWGKGVGMGPESLLGRSGGSSPRSTAFGPQVREGSNKALYPRGRGGDRKWPWPVVGGPLSMVTRCSHPSHRKLEKVLQAGCNIHGPQEVTEIGSDQVLKADGGDRTNSNSEEAQKK